MARMVFVVFSRVFNLLTIIIFFRNFEGFSYIARRSHEGMIFIRNLEIGIRRLSIDCD